MSDTPASTYVLTFGRHQGLQIKDVPAGYLLWMTNQPSQEGADWNMAVSEAAAELARRGTVVPTCDISGHALDRASLRCWQQWRQDRSEGEGLHAWLCRLVAEIDPQTSGTYQHPRLGIRFAVDFGARWPLVKTIMPPNRGQYCGRANRRSAE
jgi:hypothetical protein